MDLPAEVWSEVVGFLGMLETVWGLGRCNKLLKGVVDERFPKRYSIEGLASFSVKINEKWSMYVLPTGARIVNPDIPDSIFETRRTGLIHLDKLDQPRYWPYYQRDIWKSRQEIIRLTGMSKTQLEIWNTKKLPYTHYTENLKRRSKTFRDAFLLRTWHQFDVFYFEDCPRVSSMFGPLWAQTPKEMPIYLYKFTPEGEVEITPAAPRG